MVTIFTLAAQLRAYAEVWGTTSEGTKKPAAWIGGLVELVNGFIGLELPLDWLQIAGSSITLP
jgi:hypothetical protein